jgi:hypothetical protein
MGKNCWHYRQRTPDGYSDLAFADPFWNGKDKTSVGYFHMTAGTSDAVREWIAPHDGKVRIEGSVRVDRPDGRVWVQILKNSAEVWPSRPVLSGNPVEHDLNQSVTKGDAIFFIMRKSDTAESEKVTWDPVVTYL